MSDIVVTRGVHAETNKQFLKMLRGQKQTFLTALKENNFVDQGQLTTDRCNPKIEIYGNWPLRFKWRFVPNSLNVVVTAVINGVEQQFEFTESYFRKLIILENAFHLHK